MNVTIDDSGIEYAPVTALEMELEDSPLLADAKAIVEEARSLIEEHEVSPQFTFVEVEPEPCEQPPPPAARRQRGRPRKSSMDVDGPETAQIDQHLEFVKAQLTALPIPAEAVRVYREIIGVLPRSLVDALLPITRLVEDRS